MTIESYRFGSITVNGKTYNSDIIIYPDRVRDSWWRKSGHSLCLEDIEEVLAFKPDLLIVGQGKPGLMSVPPSVRETVRQRGIELAAMPTEKAVRRYNELSGEKRVVAAVHLTC